MQIYELPAVRAYMGHADIQTTMVYVHHTPQHDAADKLSALVARALGTDAGMSLLGRSRPLLSVVDTATCTSD